VNQNVAQKEVITLQMQWGFKTCQEIERDIKNIVLWKRKDCSVRAMQWVSSKQENIPISDQWGPEGSWRLRLPDSLTSAIECGRLSALGTGRLYPQEYPGTYFKRLS
jgi:hypothetical protein